MWAVEAWPVQWWWSKWAGRSGRCVWSIQCLLVPTFRYVSAPLLQTLFYVQKQRSINGRAQFCTFLGATLRAKRRDDVIVPLRRGGAIILADLCKFMLIHAVLGRRNKRERKGSLSNELALPR